MRRLAVLVIATSSPPVLAAKPCEELKAEIAEGMTSRGFSNFQLEVVPNSAVDARTVVGSCDGGEKKILYSRGAGAAPTTQAKVPPTVVAPQAPIRAKPVPAPATTATPAVATPTAAIPTPTVAAKPIRSIASGKGLRDPLKEGGQGPAMVVIPAGTFMMGSTSTGVDRRYRETPEHRVSIASFAMSRTEITFDDYDQFVKATKRRVPDDDAQGRGTRPVVDVNWIDATEYAQWLTAQTGFTYRLPSEAEWEYAARAGGKAGAAFSTGNCISAKQANFNDTPGTEFNNCPTANINLGKAQPVASYAPNAFGLYDMHGNVFEWTADCVHLTYERAPSNGGIWLEEDGGNCGEHIVRGGSWQSGQISVRSSLRAAIGYADASGLIGFRLVRELRSPQP